MVLDLFAEQAQSTHEPVAPVAAEPDAALVPATPALVPAAAVANETKKKAIRLHTSSTPQHVRARISFFSYAS